MGVHLMPRFARVEDNIVREIIVADELPPFHDDIATQFHEVPDEVEQHWYLDGEDWKKPKDIEVLEVPYMKFLMLLKAQDVGPRRHLYKTFSILGHDDKEAAILALQECSDMITPEVLNQMIAAIENSITWLEYYS
jgi:hypothetical protein